MVNLFAVPGHPYAFGRGLTALRGRSPDPDRDICENENYSQILT